MLLLLLLFSRGMDFLSTWIATPHLELEGNPLAKKLGWKWGIIANVVLCFVLCCWPLPAIVISTSSLLIAARNLQSAWLMRSLGEAGYREWHLQRLQETPITLYLLCLFGQTGLTAAVGFAIVYFASGLKDWNQEPVLLAIGMGIVSYAVAVLFYTTLAVWRIRHNSLKKARAISQSMVSQVATNGSELRVFSPKDVQPLP